MLGGERSRRSRMAAEYAGALRVALESEYGSDSVNPGPPLIGGAAECSRAARRNRARLIELLVGEPQLFVGAAVRRAATARLPDISAFASQLRSDRSTTCTTSRCSRSRQNRALPPRTDVCPFSDSPVPRCHG